MAKLLKILVRKFWAIIKQINKAVASPLQCLIVYMIPCPLTILFLSESTKTLSSVVPSSEVNHVFFSSCAVNPAKDTYKSLFYGVCVVWT